MTSQPSTQVQLTFSLEFAAARPLAATVTLLDALTPTVQVGRATAGQAPAGKNVLHFSPALVLDYFFELRQDFAARVELVHSAGHRQHNNSLHRAEFRLSKLLTSPRHQLALELGDGMLLHISGQELSADRHDLAELTFVGEELIKPNTYLLLFRRDATGEETPLWRSPLREDTDSPMWGSTPKLSLGQLLCGASPYECTLHVECVSKGWFSESPAGSFCCSVSQLEQGTSAPAFVLQREKSKGRVKTYGKVRVAVTRTHIPTFAEYLKGGLEMNLAVSIDFTGSNGHPDRPTSLHYSGGHTPSQYARAIRSVGDVLMQYDTDKMVPVYGFGAMLPQQSVVSHFFHVNLAQNPYMHDVSGILEAYHHCLPQISFHGPTNFAPTIRSVTQGARQAKGVYTILLILTDGEITDLPDTTDAIVEADDATLSIVIVGIGNACDFENMVYLDGDGTFLKHRNGRVSRRDLVQFVPFRDYERAQPHVLAAEVLRELPDQFLSWAQMGPASKKHLSTCVAPPSA